MSETILICLGMALLAPGVVRLAPRGAGWILGLALCVVAGRIAWYFPVIAAGESVQTSFPWLPELGVNWSFYLDGLSLIFGLLITGIGALVLIYAGSYWSNHAHLGRLQALLLAFLASMLGVVFADNVFTLFIFWELTGLASYFLIGINHEKAAARSAALQAFLVTGAGGLALLAGFVLLGAAGGSYELSQLAAERSAVIEHALYVPMLCLILFGAFTKSAQFPFHFWLPRAMEAPTPVSAYLHSATMVKAGVYLLARLSPTLGGTAVWNALVTCFGATTFAVGAAMALGQTDLKRILAYSTVSILGALTLLIGMGTREAAIAAIILLIAHALYKAGLFLVAGAVEHGTGTRDLRQLGGLARAMPITAAAAVLAAASSAGMLPLLGFIAKESVYGAVLSASADAVFLTLLMVVGNMLLVCVSGMVGWRPFFGATDPTLSAPVYIPHESPPGMWLGPTLLALGSLTLGLFPAQADVIVAAGTASICGEAVNVHLAVWHGFNLVLVLSAATLVGGVAIYLQRESLLSRLGWVQTLGRFGPERGYGIGLEGLNRFARWQTRMLQSGHLRSYVVTIILTLIGLAGYALMRDADTLTLTGWTGVAIHEIVPPFLVLAGAVMAARSVSRLAAVTALGAVGFGVVLIFVLFGAPDLAMTQFAIESLTVILFVFVLYRLPRFLRFTSLAVRVRDLAVAGALGGLITLILLAVTSEPLQTGVSDYLAAQSLPLGKGRNVVNVILVDFRALDTLGEITVLAIAAIGVHALIRQKVARKADR